MNRWFAILMFTSLLHASRAGTIGTFTTSVGTMELEFYDEDKPVTVSNFIRYVDSGRFSNIFIHRWEPNFVIQAGGWFVTNLTTTPQLALVPTFGTIVNEYSAGHPHSNTYGTIAMARNGTNVNSASSQWYLNLTNNSFLDHEYEGYTVFGHVTKGTNVLNLFIPPPPSAGIYAGNIPTYNITPPLLAPNETATFNDLIYIDIKLRRDVGLGVHIIRGGARQVTWTTVANQTNILEMAASFPPAWQPLTNFVGDGQLAIVFDRSPQKAFQSYRVRVNY